MIRPIRNVDIPAIGAWVCNGSGAEGQVIEHVTRPGRPVIIRVKFRDRYGAYQAHELRDVGE